MAVGEGGALGLGVGVGATATCSPALTELGEPPDPPQPARKRVEDKAINVSLRIFTPNSTSPIKVKSEWGKIAKDQTESLVNK